MTAAPVDQIDDYASTHDLYRRAGWPGPLPLPSGQKFPPPRDWTGWTAPYPSFADSYGWAEDAYAGTRQLGLRMGPTPDGRFEVIGIDVDAYGDKHGDVTLAAAVAQWGPLPAAPRSSARGIDNPSGIRFFLVPAGSILVTQLKVPTGHTDRDGRPIILGDVEIIQRSHRYAVTWPSIHPSGTPYQWWGRSGAIGIPQAARLPHLPQRWLDGMTRAATPGQDPASVEQVAAFARTHSHNPANTSAIKGMLALFEREASSGSRHDAALNAACMAAREARAGHYPADAGRRALREAFLRATTVEARAGQRQLTPAAAAAEIDSLWRWGVGQALALSVDECRARTGAHSGGAVLPPARKLSTPAPVVEFEPDVDQDEDEPVAKVAQGRKLRKGTVPATTSPLASGAPQVVNSDTVHARVTPPSHLRVVDGDGSGDGGSDDSTWAPIDLGPYLNGKVERVEPSVGLLRRDGVRLFYPGKEHAIIGEMESGKSWVSLASVATELADGNTVLYVHFEEDDPSDTVTRLLLLGAAPEDIQARFRFIAPTYAISLDVVDLLVAMRPTLVILDGQNEAMSLHGQGIREEDGAAAYRRELVKPFTSAGAAVVSCDHVVKGEAKGDGYALGSVHKGNGINGTIVLLENEEPFGIGRRGATRVYVTKDRPGMVRRHGQPTDVPRKFFMGVIAVDARDEEQLHMAFHPPTAEDVEDVLTGGRIEWFDGLRQPAIPVDASTYKGAGNKAIADLVRFLRVHADGDIVGVNHAGASRALVALKDGRKTRHSADTVRRAWEALFAMGRLTPTARNPRVDPLGYMQWVTKDGDPS